MTRLVIGVGNEYRSDDAAGLEVARRIRNSPACESRLGGFELIDTWAGAGDVVVVDAMRSGARPGTVRRYDAVVGPLPSGRFASSHAIGVAETIELARRLGRLPPQLCVIGIEASSFANGTELSTDVASAVDVLAMELDTEAADA